MINLKQWIGKGTKCPGLIHVDIWKKVDGWNENFSYWWFDTDFALKLWKLNIEF